MLLQNITIWDNLDNELTLQVGFKYDECIDISECHGIHEIDNSDVEIISVYNLDTDEHIDHTNIEKLILSEIDLSEAF